MLLNNRQYNKQATTYGIDCLFCDSLFLNQNQNKKVMVLTSFLFWPIRSGIKSTALRPEENGSQESDREPTRNRERIHHQKILWV